MPKTILLVKPPFFSPLTPPLGLGLLKAHLARHGHDVRCFDFNTDEVLWNTHHHYFSLLWRNETVGLSDGYSQLWNVLNAHLLAHLGGAGPAAIARVLAGVLPIYDMRLAPEAVAPLLAVVDRFFARMHAVLAALPLEAVSVIGTSTYTTSLAPSLLVLREAKRRNPAAMTVMGGGVFSDDLAYGSENLEILAREHAYVDHIVLGEGELLLLRLVEGELADRRIVQISDIAGKVLPKDEPILPDFSDFAVGEYYHLSIEGGRSCPFQCNFCSETVQWGEYRRKPKGMLAEQVMQLADRFGNRTFFLGDSIMDPYITDFAAALTERGVEIQYDGYLRADKLAGDRERALAWRRSGLFRVRLGVESASASVLERMQKMTTPQRISAALKSLAGAGIRTTTYWIAGFPGETDAELEETLAFIREHARLIYELEPHPYWYYPYGQVGSRLFRAVSLYPPEVTEVIKFKQWEVAGARPDRKEKFARLRRLVEVAAEVGIPNIYTVEQRSHAERRWLELHPLAREVYRGTRRPPREAVPRARRLSPAADGPAAAGDVICHDVAVAALNVERLRRAMATVTEVTGFGPDGAPIIERVADGDVWRPRIAGALIRAIAPAKGRLASAAVIEGAEPRAHLLVAMHRSVVDARGLAAWLEELAWIYRRMEHGVEPAPRPGAEAPAGAGAWPSGERAHAAWSEAAVSPGALAPPADLIECGVDSEDVIARAVLAALHGSRAAVSMTIDRRIADERSAAWIGAGTIVRAVPDAIVEVDDPLVGARALHAWRRDPDGATSAVVRGGSAVLLDLGALAEPPWMGGDAWTSAGFVVDASPRAGAEMVIAPEIDRDGASVRIGCEGRLESARDELASAILAELERTSAAVAAHASARRWWRTAVPGSGLRERRRDAARSEILPPDRAALDSALLDAAASAAGLDVVTLVLGCSAVLAAHASRRDDVVVLVLDETAATPRVLRAAWDLPVLDQLRETARALDAQRARGVSAAVAYREWTAEHGHDAAALVDVVCVLGGGAAPATAAPLRVEWSPSTHEVRCVTRGEPAAELARMLTALLHGIAARAAVTVREAVRPVAVLDALRAESFAF